MTNSNNNYVSFIPDHKFLKCVEELYKSYESSKNEYIISKFFNNRIDPIKLIFDKTLNNRTDKQIITTEIQRQIDKNINNFIGHFHEQLLGSVDGYEHQERSGYDVRKLDNTIFAEVKNKFNTVNSSSLENTYQKLVRFADEYPNAKCYWVAIIANNSYHKQWQAKFGDREYNHPRVYKISGDEFYHLLTGDKTAFAQVCEAIPKVLNDFLEHESSSSLADNSRIYDEIKSKAEAKNTDILTELFNENFKKYNGFPIK